MPPDGGSILVVKTSPKAVKVRLKYELTVLISGKRVSSSTKHNGYEVL